MSNNYENIFKELKKESIKLDKEENKIISLNENLKLLKSEVNNKKQELIVKEKELEFFQKTNKETNDLISSYNKKINNTNSVESKEDSDMVFVQLIDSIYDIENNILNNKLKKIKRKLINYEKLYKFHNK